ncbi:regulatory protein RecX [Membranihabitans marinus]|uniref:regulatory protein RecX n=1 Tax=Membranihabitans marinus TaxID=1227546 RepID=UPI001F31378B|nr:RecX family transcriptional regulator [Membranihabitans marinus]
MTDKEKALQRMQKYCAIQDQSVQKVREKLFAIEALTDEERESIVDDLLDDKFLDDLRFAKNYVTSMINQKRWGKYKIIQGLHRHKIASNHIDAAIKTIDSSIYLNNLEHLYQIKKNYTEDKHKIIRFLQQKGYEIQDIFKFLS